MAELLALREREGLTYEELGERTGVAPATLSWWSWRLRRDRRLRPALVTVEVVDETESSDRSGVSIELEHRGVVVRVDRDFDEATLDRVVRALGERC